ncbi:MAG TPA: tetratricopeptide repeat protein [Anaerolineae bacterium]|nr:tetratricopeptide repeat protein [Anaerolineae bacterium]
MKIFYLPKAAIMFIPIVILTFLSTLAFAQGDTGGMLVKSPQTEAFDKGALEKLKKMSPQEVEDLDKKLAQALTLLYDREYARALPIFREISDQVETMDVMFWFASCAAKAGEKDLAITKFRDMLAIEPDLHRVRLELGTVYFEMGKYDEARKELNAVLEAKPLETVQSNIKRLLAAIDEKTKRLFVNARISLGVQSDSNVSSGPDLEFIDVPEGGTIVLSNTQRSLRDWVGVISLAGNALYDAGEKRGWMWNTTGSFYQTHVDQYHNFDFTQLRLTTGPWLVSSKSVLKLPVGYAKNIYEHDHLYDTFDLSPSYEYFFTPGFSLRGMFSYLRDTYDPSSPPDDKSGQNNINRIWEINPNFYLNNRKDILSFYISDENLNAKNKRFSYDANNLAVSYFKRLNWWNWDLEIYTRYKYTRREYATSAFLWPDAYFRTDKRHNFYVVFSRNFSNRYFASISYNLINNNSNTELYDFKKDIYGFNVGVKF